MQRFSRSLVIGLVAAATLGPGCRGDLSPDPPVHLNPNMDNQSYHQAQEPNAFFTDKRAMRPQVPGTIARHELKDNLRFHQGKRPGGQWTNKLGVRLTRATLDRGRQRYDIYCSPCHGLTGESRNSVMMKKNMTVPPPSYLDPRLRAMPLGQLLDVINNGVRNMPPYRDRMPAADRWAIVAYVRALQVAGSAPIQRIPRAIRVQKGWGK